jgi:hypothetical protein
MSAPSADRVRPARCAASAAAAGAAAPPRSRSRLRAPALALAGCGLIGGCALGKEVTAFPPGLEPLEANTADWPDATDGARYPEEQNLNTGDAEDDELGVDYSWSHGRGYIQMPINKVYQALVVPRVNADRREIDSYEVTWDVEPDYPHSYVLSNVVNDVLTIEFDVTWRHGATAGSEDEPEQIGSRWQKTEGSTVIEILRGSVRTFPVSDDVTAVEMVLHQRTLQRGFDSDRTRAYLQDFYVALLAEAHGEPLPEYESGL